MELKYGTSARISKPALAVALNPYPVDGLCYRAGGIFIGMSFAWARVVDGMVLDKGDVIGSAVALIGVAIVLLWPRGSS